MLGEDLVLEQRDARRDTQNAEPTALISLRERAGCDLIAGLVAAMRRSSRACAARRVRLASVHWTAAFRLGEPDTACGSVAQVVRAYA